jgi:hypothetical protein
MSNTLKLVKTHFGDISIHLDCLHLGTFGPVMIQSPFLKHTQVSEYFPYYCLAFLPGGLFAGWLAAVLHPFFIDLSNLLIVREPLERLDDAHKGVDGWELILYILSLSFIIEGMCSFTHFCVFLINNTLKDSHKVAFGCLI